jgi:hypothetical protein
MATKDKSELDRAERAYRKAADAFETRRHGSAENPMRAPGQANPELDEAELAKLDAEISLKEAEAQAAADDPDVATLASWLADALEKCMPALEVAPPAPPVLASFAPTALDAYADALTDHNAKLPAYQKACAVAVARVQSVWRAALAGQGLLQAARKAAGAPAPRVLVTSEGLPGKRAAGGGSHLAGQAVPYSSEAIADVCVALRENVVTADTSALENRREQLAELIATRAAQAELADELATMTPAQIAFESNWGRGSAREDQP